MGIKLNYGYMHGANKMMQIGICLVMFGLLCMLSRYGSGRHCFADLRISFVSGLVVIAFLANILLLILNLLTTNIWKGEFWFDIVATMLFAISAAFIAWFVIENQLYQRTFLLISGGLAILMALLLFCDAMNLKFRYRRTI